jgi:sec-independent protein translocase protein TatB
VSVFGFSFGELVVLVIVAVVVIGPKDLPKMLRRAGQWAGKLRRMAADLRAQSGIDDVLRNEGLAQDLAEIRKLARGELDTVAREVRLDAPSKAPSVYDDGAVHVSREREHPQGGPDVQNAMPDTAFVYVEGFPRSKWAEDPVWVLGDPDGVIEKPNADANADGPSIHPPTALARSAEPNPDSKEAPSEDSPSPTPDPA